MAKTLVYSVDSVHASLLKSQPPMLLVAAQGVTTTTGWARPRLVLRDKNELSADGVLDLLFVADPPETGGDAMTPIAADFVWNEDAEKVRAVIVYARSNQFRTEVARLELPLSGPAGPGNSPWTPQADLGAQGAAAVFSTESARPAFYGGAPATPAREFIDPNRVYIDCRNALQDAYARIGKVIGGDDSPALNTLHPVEKNWRIFFYNFIQPLITAHGQRYVRAQFPPRYVSELHTEPFSEILRSLAEVIVAAYRVWR